MDEVAGKHRDRTRLGHLVVVTNPKSPDDVTGHASCSNSSYESYHLHVTMVLGTSGIETPPAYPSTAGQNGDVGPLGVGRRGGGFPRNHNFFIRKKGTEHYLLSEHFSYSDGALLHLWPLQAVNDIGRKNQVCIDAFCSAYVDVGD